MVISLLHPSRSRISKSIETTTKWATRSTAPFELIVSVDADDPQIQDYRDYYGEKLIINYNRSAVDAINNAAKVCTGDIMIVLSDDTDCPLHWDEKILDATKGRTDFVLRVNDEIQHWLITMPVIDRAYYNRFGYIYYEGFVHMFCDTEFTHVANMLGRVIRRNDIFFPHLHYSVAKGKRDALNERADATWNQGKALYLERFKQAFGLQGVDPWNISDEKHKQWIRNAL